MAQRCHHKWRPTCVGTRSERCLFAPKGRNGRGRNRFPEARIWPEPPPKSKPRTAEIVYQLHTRKLVQKGAGTKTRKGESNSSGYLGSNRRRVPGLSAEFVEDEAEFAPREHVRGPCQHNLQMPPPSPKIKDRKLEFQC
eukprot:1152232-Rhodomonas_salina.4